MSANSETEKRLRKIWLAATCVYALGVLALSLLRLPSTPGAGIAHIDKIGHAVAYAILAALLYQCLRTDRVRNSLLAALVLSFIFGTLIEFLQLALTDYRTFSYPDMAANLLGALAATGSIGLIQWRRLRYLKRGG